MKLIFKQVEKLRDTLIKDRRYLHENAEVGMELPVTTKYVIERLKSMGYNPQEICQSGVVAIVGKKSGGKTFLLRADMDALPIREESGLAFASKSETAHACGHDLHTAMLLGAARLLKDNEDNLNGQVKLMFQPGEEILSGAKAMVEAGLLENPKVDAAMMIHVLTGFPIPAGKVIKVGEGVIAAAADWFRITIQGKGCHGAMPQMGVDPLVAASSILLGLQNIHARELAPGVPAVVTVGQIHGGNIGNIIPDTAFLEGTIRSLNADVRKFIKERVASLPKSVAESLRTSAEITFFRECPSNINNGELLAQLAEYTKQVVGEQNFIDKSDLMSGAKISGSEDFAYVSEKVPSVMFGLSAGSSEDGHKFSQHHPGATFDESALPVGAAVYANAAIEWLLDAGS